MRVGAGRQIRIYLADGTAGGLLTAEIMNSTGHIILPGQRTICERRHGPRCRTHHRAKQARDWKVEQIAPGVTRWTLPSGRTHITTPTRYDT